MCKQLKKRVKRGFSLGVENEYSPAFDKNKHIYVTKVNILIFFSRFLFCYVRAFSTNQISFKLNGVKINKISMLEIVYLKLSKL